MNIVGVKVMVETGDGPREVCIPLAEFAKLFTYGQTHHYDMKNNRANVTHHIMVAETGSQDT